MSATYRIEPIPTLATRRIVQGNRTVGFAYPPKREGEPWELTPPAKSTDGLPDGDRGYRTRRFPAESDLMAFLGLSPASETA